MPVCRIDYLRVAWKTSQERGTTFGLVGEFTGPLFGARRLRSAWKIRSNDLSFARLNCLGLLLRAENIDFNRSWVLGAR